MLIASNFKDYYDTAIGVTGVDKTIVYVRKTQEELEVPPIFKEISKLRSRLHYTFTYECKLEPVIIGFCGKIYAFLYQPITETNKKTVVYTNMDSLNAKYPVDLVERLFGSPRYRNYNANALLKAFFDLNTHSLKFRDYFLDSKVACFVIKESPMLPKSTADSTFEIDPQLRLLNFASLVDPYTATQELMMFISGVLGSPCEQMMQIADVDILEGKGFDKVKSFRKAPTKKRR